MRLLILAAALAVPMSTTASPPPPAVSPQALLPEGTTPVARLDERNCLGRPGAATTRGKPLRATRLGDLPAGNLSLTVLREFDGCPQSTVIRTGYGAAPAAER